MRSSRLPLVGLALVVALTACDGFGQQQPPAVIVDPTTDPTWVDHIAPLMDAYCNTCHAVPAARGVPEDFRLDVFEDTDILGAATMAQDSLDTMEGTGRPMPPRDEPQMADSEIALFARWVEIGTPYDTSDLAGGQ